jgi:hypothetical protein
MDEKRRNAMHIFREKNINLMKLLNFCEIADRNSDGFIHILDLSEILNNKMGIHVTEREIRSFQVALQPRISNTLGLIDYRKLNDLKIQTEIPPTCSKGTIGHFIDQVACPAEVKSFELFLYLIEKYESDTGYCCETTETGFKIPFGPNLTATVSFSLNR